MAYKGTWQTALLWPPLKSGAAASGAVYQTMTTLPDNVETHVIDVSPGGSTDWEANLLLRIRCSYPIRMDGQPPMTITLPARGDEGFDVSRHNENVDWLAAKNAGRTFAIYRTTMGATGVDYRWRQNRFCSRIYGFKDTAYHYLIHNESAKAQHENMAGQIGADFGCLPVVGDVERRRDANKIPEVVDRAGFTIRLYDWLRYSEDAWKHKPLIYTNVPEWLAMTTRPAWTTEYQFIVAQYNIALTSVLPEWDVVCWQYAVKPVSGMGPEDIDHERWLGQTAPIPTAHHNFVSLHDPKYGNTNQAVINLFQSVTPDFIAWLTRAMLLNALAAARPAVYSGPDVEDLPGLSPAEKAALIAAMG